MPLLKKSSSNRLRVIATPEGPRKAGLLFLRLTSKHERHQSLGSPGSQLDDLQHNGCVRGRPAGSDRPHML
jgi:hypothetical protein